REPGSLRAQEEGRKCPLGKKNSQPGRASEISTLNFCVKLPARKKLDSLAFIFFVFLTLIMTFHWLGLFKMKALNLFSQNQFQKLGSKSSFFHGLLSVALPCGLLAQILTLSVISGSIWGGGLIGLIHANTSTLGLWLGTR
ncbi:MAG: sulfite exporter TauE/SafE family protein, partial [Bdellovibrionales bacterium]